MRLFVCMAAAILCFALPVLAALTPEEKVEVENLIKTYIKNNSGDVIQALQEGEITARETEIKEAENTLTQHMDYLTGSDVPVTGNVKDPDVVVVEFFDYNCGHCHEALKSVKSLIAQDSAVQVRFIEMPILHSSSELAASWALAAAQQDKYFDFHAALMEHAGALDESVLETMAKDLNLDIDRLKKDAQSPEIQARLDEMKNMARTLGIRGTPAFIVGGKIYPGFMDPTALKSAVAEARTKNAS